MSNQYNLHSNKPDSVQLPVQVQLCDDCEFMAHLLSAGSDIDRVSVPSPIAIDMLMDTMARDRAHMYLFSV